MISFTKNGDELIVEGNKVKFPYPIYKAEEFNGLIIVVLDFRNTDNPNELYGVSNKGQIVWKMEDVQNVLASRPAPLVNYHIIDNKLVVIDHCAQIYNQHQRWQYFGL
jgi:hypothetical protein